jgi:hypothetical protein
MLEASHGLGKISISRRTVRLPVARIRRAKSKCSFRFLRPRDNKHLLPCGIHREGAHMKRLTGLTLGIFSLITVGSVAQAADSPARQEGRIWAYQNLTLAFSPNWSFTTMPGGRVEFARSKEDRAGFHFAELFMGPNYAYKFGPNLTVKGSLWYYYMGYPGVGRNTMPAGGGPASCANNNTYTCNSNYNFSHNLEIIPSVEYRMGRWSIYDRVIFHNTFYADAYNKDVPGMDVDTLRWGWGTVLRELLEVRYALTDRLGVSSASMKTTTPARSPTMAASRQWATGKTATA